MGAWHSPGGAGPGPSGAIATPGSSPRPEDDTSEASARATLLVLAIVGACCLTSLFVAAAGLVVALQYPTPRCLCWRTPYSDAGGRGCCSLYRANIGLSMLWVLFMVIMAILGDRLLMAVCVGFTFLHLLSTYLLRKAFSQHGVPVWNDPPVAAWGDTGSLQPQGGTPRGRTVTGLPVFQIPMIRAEVGDAAFDDTCSCPACQQFKQLDARLMQSGVHSPGAAAGPSCSSSRPGQAQVEAQAGVGAGNVGIGSHAAPVIAHPVPPSHVLVEGRPAGPERPPITAFEVAAGEAQPSASSRGLRRGQ